MEPSQFPIPLLAEAGSWSGTGGSDRAYFKIKGTMLPAPGQPLPKKLCGKDVQVNGGYGKDGNLYASVSMTLSNRVNDPKGLCYDGTEPPVDVVASFTLPTLDGNLACRNIHQFPLMRLAMDRDKGEAPGMCTVSGESVDCTLNALTVDGSIFPGCGWGFPPQP